MISDCLKDMVDSIENDKLFIIDPLSNREISYREFYFDAQIISKFIFSNYSNREEFIVSLKNSYENLVLIFGIFLSGKRLAVIEQLKSKSEIEKLIDLFDNPVLFTDVPFEFETINNNELLEILSMKRKCIDSIDLYLLQNIRKAEIITFTSGTTDIPKGVLHSLHNLLLSADSLKCEMKIDSSKRFYHTFPMSYMAGILNCFLLPLISGSSIIIGEKFNISKAFNFWETPSKYNVNFYWFNPTNLAIIKKIYKKNFSNIKKDNLEKNVVGVVATAPLDASLWKEFEDQFGIKLHNSYGLSETLFVSVSNDVGKNYNSVGLPLKYVDISISNDEEVLIRVPWMSSKYINDDMNKYTIDGWYKSGDLGYVENGKLFINGRKKDIIIRGGININPFIIEKKLKEIFDQYDFYIIGEKDVVLGEKLVCVLVDKITNIMLSDLNKVIISEFGSEYKIDNLVKIDQIPINQNGKIDRKKLLEVYKNDN